MSNVDRQIAIQQEEDLKNVLRSEGGRRFLWRVLSYCGVYKDLEGAYEDLLRQSGRRQVGLYLLGIINETDDESFFKMMREAKNRDMEENYAREQQQQRDNATADDNAVPTASHEYNSYAGII